MRQSGKNFNAMPSEVNRQKIAMREIHAKPGEIHANQTNEKLQICFLQDFLSWHALSIHIRKSTHGCLDGQTNKKAYEPKIFRTGLGHCHRRGDHHWLRTDLDLKHGQFILAYRRQFSRWEGAHDREFRGETSIFN